MTSVNLIILGILSAGLWHSGPSVRPPVMNPEQRVEFTALAGDGGLCTISSPAGYRLAAAEWASLTPSPHRTWHGLASLITFDRVQPPSPQMVSAAAAWLPKLFPAVSPVDRLARMEQKLGIRPSRSLNGPVVLSLIHLWGIHQAFVHDWIYRAEPGDTLTEVALATGQSTATVARDNPQHGAILWVGQRVNWSAPVKPSAPQPPKSVTPELVPPSKPSSGQSVPHPSAPLTGVLANLNPLAGLVLMNPSAHCLKTVLKVDPAFEPVAAAVEGQWALLHRQLVAAWVARGHSLAVDGYSTTALAKLPLAAVSQELSWSEAVVRRITNTNQPTAVVLPTTGGYAVDAARNQYLSWLTPSVKVTAAGGRRWPAIVVHQLLVHPNQLVAVSPPSWSGAWPTLFANIHRRRIILETLRQISTAP